jgi:uncharacterized protein YdhG (YjbR/CyaY superfamily)
MDRSKEAPASIDEYISWFPDETQKKLQEMRATIHAAAPEATEKISYQMPTFFLNGNLVHFAGFKDHISFFPGAISNISEAFGDEIASYMTGKASYGTGMRRKSFTTNWTADTYWTGVMVLSMQYAWKRHLASH